MSEYQKAIQKQINEFETYPDFEVMGDTELQEYSETMEAIGYKINTYGPARCSRFREYAVMAQTELETRAQG